MSAAVDDRAPQLPAIRRGLAKAELWLHARTMPARALAWDLKGALRYGQAGPQRRFNGIASDDIARWVQRTTRKPWLMRKRRCLRQGLLGARFMRMAGYDAELYFGIDASSLDTASLSAHCWVVLDGKTVLNTPLDNMVVVLIDTPSAPAST